MGYYISMELSGLVIPAAKREECRQAILALTRDGADHISWVNDHPGEDATLAACFRAWRYSVNEVGIEGEYDLLVEYFEGEKLGSDDLLFEAIAPFVESDASVVVRGEDGESWRYLFKDGKVKEQKGEVQWVDDD